MSMNRTPKKMHWGSTYSGKLPRGCKQCIKGEKMLVWVILNGNSNGFYCPLSNERKQAETAFANERPFKKISTMLIEAKNMNAKGASMTGGDPLELHSFTRTKEFCQTLKEEFTDDFHIHVYTRGKDLNETLLGEIIPFLDEIRFHVINLKKDLPVLQLTMNFDIDVGIEVPVIPTKGFEYYKNLIERFESIIPEKDNFYFINLNELEISETNYRNLISHGLTEDKDNLSAVQGSADLALKIVEWSSQNTSIPVHYCALSTKDNIQLPNRLYRIAKKNKLPSDVLIEEGPDKGLLLRGVIRGKNHDLDEIKQYLVIELDVPADLVHIDVRNNRILTNAAILEEIHEEIKKVFPNIQTGLAEEYPSYDNLQTTFIPFD